MGTGLGGRAPCNARARAPRSEVTDGLPATAAVAAAVARRCTGFSEAGKGLGSTPAPRRAPIGRGTTSAPRRARDRLVSAAPCSRETDRYFGAQPARSFLFLVSCPAEHQTQRTFCAVCPSAGGVRSHRQEETDDVKRRGDRQRVHCAPAALAFGFSRFSSSERMTVVDVDTFVPLKNIVHNESSMLTRQKCPCSPSSAPKLRSK